MPSNSSQTRKAPSDKSEVSDLRTPLSPIAEAPSQADTLRRLYAGLLRSRLVQERAQSASGLRASNYDLRLGHEAVIVGVTAELTPSDTMMSSSRDLAALLARGAPVGALLSRNGVDASFAWCGPVIPEDPFNAGVGIALAHKLEQKRSVVVALYAQPPSDLNGWRDALMVATKHKLPILFVVERGAASSTDAASHLHPVSYMVRGHNLPAIVVDGSDVVAVWRVAQEGVHRARNGVGPTLIDCRTDPARDPLAQLEHYLRKRSVWDEAWRRELESEIAAAIADATAR